MENPNRDSEDTETSSEDSWILLSNDEAIADLAPAEGNRNFTINSLDEVVNKLTDSGIKSNQYDTESDGISIIGESDYSQISESDDDYNNTAIEFKSERQDHNQGSSIKTHQLLNKRNNKEEYENLIMVDTENSVEECFVNEENCSSNVEENMRSIDLEKAEQLTMIGKVTSKIMSERLTEDTSLYICLNHLKKLVTWPSFFCTSIVIFAVIIFPYFSSKIDNANTLDQPDTKQFDDISLTDKNMGVLDSLDLVYCMEIVKEENDNPYFKQCMKRLRKYMKRFKNNDITVQFISSSKEEYKDSNLIEYTDTFLLNKKYKRMEEYNKYENGKYKKLSKNSPIPLNFVLEDYELIGKDTEEYNEKYILTDDLLKNQEKHKTELRNSQQKGGNDGREKGFETQFQRKTFDKLKDQLNELRISLLEKEKFLKKWQEQLTAREVKLENKIKKSYYDKKKHFRKFKKQTEDSDKDAYEKKYNRGTKWRHEFLLKDKEKKNQKQHKNPAECTDKKKIKGICKVKGIFHKNNKIYYKGKKGGPPSFLGENIYKESTEKLNITLDSGYLRAPIIAKKNRTNLDDENITVDGEWYLNLVHGRHDIRKREGKASWWFDRAEFRKNRRNKAFWYFQYMINRENLRYREKNF